VVKGQIDSRYGLKFEKLPLKMIATKLSRLSSRFRDLLIIKFAYDRVRMGKPMPGVIEVSRLVPINDAIEDILLIALASESGDWEGQIVYLPLR
jgi:hypothetical protein